MNSYLYLILRDIKSAFRSFDGVVFRIIFLLMVTVLIPISTDTDRIFLERMSPGLIWIVVVLISILSMGNIFLDDFNDGSLDYLIMSPVSVGGIVLCKATAHWLSTGLPLVIASYPCSIILNISFEQWIFLFLSLLIGTPALSVIGTTGAALMIVIGRSPFILSLVIVPFYIPTMIFGAAAANSWVYSYSFRESIMLEIAVSIFVIFVFPFISASILRYGMD